MAWQARLDSAVTAPPGSLNLQVFVSYFDDADPATILHSRTFTFEPTTALADLRTTVIAEGQAARAAVQRAAVINQTIPSGSVIAIP